MMRLLVGIATAGIVLAACGGAATAPTPTPTVARTSAPAPTVAGTPAPPATGTANIFRAELKSSNENPPIVDAEVNCAGNATVTLTGTNVKFDVVISGCPAATAINIGHIHEGAAGVNGPVRIDTGLKAGDLVLSGGGTNFSRTVNAEAGLISAILSNPAGWYVNFHSALHTGGVIRGQLTRA